MNDFPMIDRFYTIFHVDGHDEMVSCDLERAILLRFLRNLPKLKTVSAWINDPETQEHCHGEFGGFGEPLEQIVDDYLREWEQTPDEIKAEVGSFFLSGGLAGKPNHPEGA